MPMMNYKLRFTKEADEQLTHLENTPHLHGTLKQVRKALGLLQINPRVKSLQTHEYRTLSRWYKRKTFEACAQQNTPGAYRIFWHYGDDIKDENGTVTPVITIIAITPHP